MQATESLYCDETPFPRLSLQDLDLAAFESHLEATGQSYLRGDDPDAGLVTRAGTGIRRIVRLVREATGREVGIEVRDFEVLLTLPRQLKPA